MRGRSSLRWRFTVASTALVFGISALSAIAVYAAQEYVEDGLLEELMQREVAEYARVYREDQTQNPPRSTELRSYIVGPEEASGLPSELRDVPPGIWHDILIDGRSYQVANFTLQDKRFYLTYDITAVEEREWWLAVALITTVLLATGLAAGIGWRLSSVVLAPVARLTSEIEQLDPARPAGLAQRHTDAELGVIAAAFDNHLGRLAEFIERERAFTEDASHELRTPITVINTAAERLGSDPALPGMLKSVVERIARAGRQMEATTRALLFMAREEPAEPAEAAMRPAPLREVIEEVIAEKRSLAPAVAVMAMLDAPGPEVPRTLAAIVIGNLLDNAVRHAGGGAVEVHQDGVRVSVRDRGAGIAPEQLSQVFERHHRSGPRAGFGLGLHIVRRICERQGWSLELDSAPGQGTAVTVGFSTVQGPP
ncbi:MAG: sensor histidine kinase [Nevskiaceae bacterium]